MEFHIDIGGYIDIKSYRLRKILIAPAPNYRQS
jgi:hypothetical protein